MAEHAKQVAINEAEMKRQKEYLDASKVAAAESAQRNKELATAQKEMDAQRQLGAAQKETQAAQRDAMREAASAKPDSGMHDMHDTGEAAEKRPVGSLLPEKKKAPTTPATPTTPTTPATVAIEKKCTDDQGEAIWCDGASSVASPVGAVDGVSPPAPAELSDA